MSRYIDADALGIGRANRDVFDNKAYADGWNSAIDIIVFAPTADVQEVRHGHWEFRIDGTYSRTRCYCTVCKQPSGIGGIRKNQLKPYCPNCGAIMDEE